jgi:hypothetical protein
MVSIPITCFEIVIDSFSGNECFLVVEEKDLFISQGGKGRSFVTDDESR